jgi:hypothetical protein
MMVGRNKYMENKVLIRLIMPDIDEEFDIFIPVNELVWKIKKLLIKSVADYSGISLNINDEYILINKDSANIYNNNDLVIDTDIRNGTELLFFINK